MTGETASQESIFERVSDLLYNHDCVRGLWLSGSLARGDADRFSDVDFVLAAGDGPLEETATEVESILTQNFDIVLLRKRGDDRFRLLNVVTFEWIRIDFSLFAPTAIVESNLRGLRRLFDKDGVGGAIEQPPSVQKSRASQQVDFALTEFARLFGLLPVVLHRSDLSGAVSGAFVLREQLIAMFRYDQEAKPTKGALNQSSTLSSDGVEVLLGLPAVKAERASILAFHRACLSAFLKYGPRVAERHEVAWPARLVEALQARLRRELGADFVEPI